MNNYYRTIIINLHRIIYYVIKARIWMRHPERHTEEERYAVAKEMVTKMNKSAGYNTIAYGTENLPKEGGYLLYPNHQGKYDVPGIFFTHEKPVSFVMDEKRSHIILVNEFLELVDGKRLVLNDPRQAITVFQQVAAEIRQGRKYILFPEGGYEENNQNVVEEFKPGSFKLAQMAKCPIVPTVLIDSFKVFNSGHKGPATTYIYYLEPIPYEEFKSMKTKDIAKMVEDRIKAKIEEHTGA
ncbi:MAG: 1-acyl-sn-glycerol-3-phosphate acyltransferase [Butyrivibrio sp.]|nr:1-acyl-sn-glycerol-3-phosphate acyltransferase [Butyrivibrio sp.]